ncbi:muconolactone Delta-isomerase [Vibrio sp.]|nr:muconolactone Delta-isomerase [Vibrio sp.]
MLFKVEMMINIPDTLPQDEVNKIKATEKQYSQKLQSEGIWLHIWRVVGEYANVSIFDVKDNEHLHEVLTGLPLFPYMTFTITPLCSHPSAIK